MIYFEIESNREVSVSGVGILTPGEPHRLTDEERIMFKIHNGQDIVGAQFAPYVKVTAVLEEEVDS